MILVHYVQTRNSELYLQFTKCDSCINFRVMFPPAKRHAGSRMSLQPMDPSRKFVSVTDEHGLDRRIPVNDTQFSQILSIVSHSQGNFFMLIKFS